MERYYKLCQQHMGKVARITDRNGRVHVGRIERVSNRKVYIRPVGGSRGGFGYGYYGGYYGWGAAYGIGLGFITGFALAGLFFFKTAYKRRPPSFGRPFICLYFLHFVHILFEC